MRRTLSKETIRYTAIAAFLALAAGFHFSGTTAGLVLSLAAALLLLFMRMFRAPQSRQAQRTEPRLHTLAQIEAQAGIAGVQVSVLGAPFRKEQWERAEKVVDMILDTCLKLMSSTLNAHTVAVFFPGADQGYCLRRFVSKSPAVLPGATIRPGLGVVGGLFKDGIKTLNLQDIANDSTTLYYYAKDVGVRSLLCVPVIAATVQRGMVIADSTEIAAFTRVHLQFLEDMAELIGQSVYHAYLHTEHALEHQRLAAVSTIEKEFFRHQSIDAILDILADVIPFALPCDRLTISMRSDDGETGTIRRSVGMHADELQNRRFLLTDKSLASILYGKNICFSRNFAPDRYEVRYYEQEPRHEGLASFLAVPIGIDSCKGMILMESMRRDAFSDAIRELLIRIATSAGLAIEKMVILEKANAMATHDGLTGLFNHRQFQQLLGDEITRSIRYGDPLALVLCDIDFFKKVNDTYGHQFGDIVLKEVAVVLDSSIRQGIDTASRYGGEEFALILVKTGEEQAIETAERIRVAIEKMLFKSPSGSDVHVTMSFGIALFNVHAREAGELIKKADKALYRAKQQGRNRVELF